MLHERAHALIRRYNRLRVLWPSHPVRLAGDVQDQGPVRVEDISAGTPFVSEGVQQEERGLFPGAVERDSSSSQKGSVGECVYG